MDANQEVIYQVVTTLLDIPIVNSVEIKKGKNYVTSPTCELLVKYDDYKKGIYMQFSPEELVLGDELVAHIVNKFNNAVSR